MKLRAFVGKVRHLVANLRAHQRQSHDGVVVVSWKQAGEVITLFGCCRDLSDSGIGIALPESLEYGRKVYITSSVLGRSRTAEVRYCRSYGTVFHIGFEFTNVPDFTPIWQFKEMELLMDGVNW